MNGANCISVEVHVWFNSVTSAVPSRHVQIYLEDCAITWHNCQSRWPCDLRHRSAVARIMRSLVQNPAEGIHVCLLTFICDASVSALTTDPSLVQRSPTGCVSDLKT